MTSQKWTSQQIARTVLRLGFEVKGADWEQDVLLTADRHLDNPDTDRALQIEHLEEAKLRGAPVLDFGDLFDAMQGKTDRRSAKSKLRQEDKENAYLDALVKNNAKFLQPFAKQFALIGQGNHETGVLKIHETDLTERLVTTLNDRTSAKISAGGYSGFVRFAFKAFGTENHSLDLYYHHGSGGGGIVTKGVIASNRRASHVMADIYVSGHVHESWAVEIPRTRLTQAGVIEHAPGWHIQLPSYKEEYKDGAGGYHIENGRPAKPVGAWWLRFYYDRVARRVRCEPHKARGGGFTSQLLAA